MKKLFFLLLSLACVSLEATHFQSSMSVTPGNSKDQYLVEMEIKKYERDDTPEFIMSPKLICVQGDSTEITFESEDKLDLLFIRVTIPQNIQTGIQASVLMKEKGAVVLSFDNTIKLSN